ncbi:MAG: SDR family oxidoreductase [Proteobacteria bacterium]|nr:SDR family oxidoreductase [Pseudomonadota bacterium]MBU1737730.1 SDR family oxidoreductase [Pseudomonadota bacterium]
MEIREKKALVLGGGKGIGRDIGFFLADQGATVAMTYHDDWPDESAAMCRQLEALGGSHLAVKVDLRAPDQIQTLLRNIEASFGELHILINNIERGGMPVVHGQYVPEQWTMELETTLMAKRWVFHHALPLLKKSGGSVINISSIAGVVGRSGPAGMIFNDGYSAANRAISLLTETWAREGAPKVRVNELMLGFFAGRHAEGTRGWGMLDRVQQQAIIDHTLLERTGNREDVLQAIRFLLFNADFMTGSTLKLDGGYTLGADRVPPMPEGV